MQAGSKKSPARPAAADRAQRSGMVQAVTERLRTDILSGDLPAGAQLRQDHIAADFGVSHIPVREAFRRLEADGLVTTIPRRGAFVSRMSGEDAREITEMRVALETLAVRLSVPNAPSVSLAAAEDALRIAGQSGDIADWSAMNLQFHRALYAPCGRPRLLSTIEGFMASGGPLSTAGIRGCRLSRQVARRTSRDPRRLSPRRHCGRGSIDRNAHHRCGRYSGGSLRASAVGRSAGLGDQRGSFSSK